MFIKESLIHLKNNVNKISLDKDCINYKKLNTLKIKLKNIEKHFDESEDKNKFYWLYDIWRKEYLEIIKKAPRRELFS